MLKAKSTLINNITEIAVIKLGLINNFINVENSETLHYTNIICFLLLSADFT